MAAKVDILIPVQELDLEIHKLRGLHSEKPREIRFFEEKASQAKTALEGLKGEIKALRLEAAKREGEIKEIDEKAGKLTVQANQAKKNDEYQTLMKQISGLKADKAKIEDSLLDLYMQADEKEKLVRLKEGDLKDREAECVRERKRIEGEAGALEQRLGELGRRRDELTHGLDGEIFRIYQRILQAKDDGVAMVPVVHYEVVEEDGKKNYWACGGCNMGIISQDLNLVKIGREVILCKSCARILYTLAN